MLPLPLQLLITYYKKDKFVLTKVEYRNLEERQLAIEANVDKFLVEEQNITEGNFLIFSNTKTLEMQINDLNNTVNIILLKQEGII